jgi:hypothetical protein
LPAIEDLRQYQHHLHIFSSYRIKCRIFREKKDQTKTDISYDIEKQKIVAMHFFKFSIESGKKLEPETLAYFEEIGLNKQILNFEILKMKSSFTF